MAGIEQLLRARLAAAFESVTGAVVDPVVHRSQHADFQSNAALDLTRDARGLAGQVIAAADLADLCDRVEVAGPGFINLTVSGSALSRLVGGLAADDRLGVSTVEPETVVVDYSAPNAAKEMHVGHLRSTVIGDAVARLLEWLGHRVIRQNHVGDWGTPFAMLVEHSLDTGAYGDDLNEFYVAARRKFDENPAFRRRARDRVVLLQAGDEATMRLWHSLITISQRYFMSVYHRLGVLLRESDFAGESAYNADLDGIVAELARLRLLRTSDGAECVFPPGFTNRDGEPLPLIVRKSDGGYGYAATDLAALRHRVDDLKATRLLYVIGTPQRQHLELVFATAAAAGWLAPPVRAVHVGFGSVLGKDGRILRSRAGGVVKLTELLDEATERAAAIVHDAITDPGERAEVARAVAMGALKYADLSTDRVKDYVFDLDRMVSYTGNAGPYLQFAYVRSRSVLRKALIAPGPIVIIEPAEHTLAIELLRFATVVEQAAETLELHRLAGYLYGVATALTALYEALPIRDSPSRLALCELTARTLRVGLGLLGIEALERM